MKLSLVGAKREIRKSLILNEELSKEVPEQYQSEEQKKEQEEEQQTQKQTTDTPRSDDIRIKLF